MIKELCDATLRIKGIDEEKYSKLLIFLDDSKIKYDEIGFEQYIEDTRTEEQKHQDYLSEQADLINDEKRML